MHGLVGKGHTLLPQLYRRHSRDTSPQFMRLLFAVMAAESGFNKYAISSAGARGLLQLMPIAVRESEKRCNLRPLRSLDELHDSATNVRYGSCYLAAMLDDARGNIDKALILYNGGTRALTAYQNGESINAETADYVVKVRRFLGMCNKNAGR